MTELDDLAWLARHAPAVPPPDPAATAAARAALLAHVAAGDRRPAPTAAPAAATRPRAARRWLRPSRVLALAGAAAVAAALVAGIPRLGDGGVAPALPAASAAPLVALSETLVATPAPAGDATLVLRRHAFPDDAGFTGADLYLDDGRYFYSPTRAGLPAQIAAGNASSENTARVLAAVAGAAAPGADMAAARRRVIRIALGEAALADIGGSPPVLAPAAEAARAKREVVRPPGPVADPLPTEVIEQNRLWITCMDALIAGAGRPDVRAGALRLLASVPSTGVADAEVDGRRALAVSSKAFGDGYEERLLLDAGTGVPLRFEGGVPEAEPSVVVTYEVSRVDAADVAGG